MIQIYNLKQKLSCQFDFACLEKTLFPLKVTYSRYTITYSSFINYVWYTYSVLGILLGSGDKRCIRELLPLGLPIWEQIRVFKTSFRCD